jgi:hypothetical protein
VRFGRRVKHRKQHLEDPHADNEQDGEREPAHLSHTNVRLGDHADEQPNHYGRVLANDSDHHDCAGAASDGENDDHGRGGQRRHRHLQQDRHIEDSDRHQDRIQNDRDEVHDQDRNRHRAHDDDDRDPNSRDDHTDDYDDDQHHDDLEPGGSGRRRGGGRCRVEGEELLGVGRSPGLGLGADRGRRSRGRRRRLLRDSPAATQQADGSSEPGPTATTTAAGLTTSSPFVPRCPEARAVRVRP